jgi:hypothetical protein
MKIACPSVRENVFFHTGFARHLITNAPLSIFRDFGIALASIANAFSSES